MSVSAGRLPMSVAWMARIVAATLLILLVLGGLFLWSRRSVGAFGGPPPGAAMWLAGPILALAAVCVRLLWTVGKGAGWRSSRCEANAPTHSLWQASLASGLVTLALLLLASALSLPAAGRWP